MRVPSNISGSQRRILSGLVDAYNRDSRTDGIVYSEGEIPSYVQPDIRESIFGVIRDDQSGSGSGSGSGHAIGSGISNFTGAGFYDSEGYLAYSFDQTYDTDPWKGVIVPNGITTDMAGEGVNFAYPLGSAEFAAGDIVYLVKCGRHWAIIGTVGDVTGSGSGAGIHTWHFNCDTGLLTQLR